MVIWFFPLSVLSNTVTKKNVGEKGNVYMNVESLLEQLSV